MIALILLALGLGVALTAYELSPHARANVDDYARAIREAHAAHRAADAHLYAAGAAPPDQAMDHAIAAKEANQAAAKSTADAAKNAKTDAEHGAVASSAGKVVDREQQITAALVSLGIGQCGVRSYARVTDRVKDQILTKLHDNGMTVTGDNPWDIDTHNHDVKLHAVWIPKTQVLKLIVTAGKGGSAALGLHKITCDDIWDAIEPTLKDAIGAPPPAVVGYARGNYGRRE